MFPCFHKGKAAGVSFQLESLISIRICRWDPGATYPGRHRRWTISLQGISDNGGGDKPFHSDALFIQFWASLLTVFFLPFYNFPTEKTSQKHPSSLTKVGKCQSVWQSVATSWHLSVAIIGTASAVDISQMVIPTRTQPPQKQPRPPPIIRAPLECCTPYVWYHHHSSSYNQRHARSSVVICRTTTTIKYLCN
jgi:hypothetical protein